MSNETGTPRDHVPELNEIDLNAAWLGNELDQREDWRRRLDGDEIEECVAAAKRLSFDAQNATPDEIIAWLPKLSHRLKQIQFDLENHSGATLLQGFPIERIDASATERLFVALMSRVGTPVPQTTQGSTLFHVRDEGFDSRDPRARGPSSRNRLSFHSDRCDVIAFLCIRDASRGGDNQIVSSVALFERMKRECPELLQELMRPFWYKRHNVDSGNEHAYYQQPVFSVFEGRFASSLLRVLIDRAYADPHIPDMTQTQREALDLVESMANLEEMNLCFHQHPGDIVLLNNFVTLHRRTEFEDDIDPAKKRHLLRLWLAMPNSRPLAPEFKASYGETAAGAVRGGMRSGSSF